MSNLVKNSAKGLKNQRNLEWCKGKYVDTFGFLFFFSPGLPEGSRPRTDPKIAFPYWKIDHFMNDMPSISTFHLRILQNQPKSGRDGCSSYRTLTRSWPNVDPTLTQRWPNVDRRSGVGSHQGPLAGPLGRPSRPTLDGGSPPNVSFFFGGRKVLAPFFRPIRATVETLLDLTFFARAGQIWWNYRKTLKTKGWASISVNRLHPRMRWFCKNRLEMGV